MIETKFIKVPLYGNRLHLVLCDDSEAHNIFFKEKDNEVPDNVLVKENNEIFASTIDGCERIEDIALAAIYVRLNPNNEYDKLTYGVIAHEATHVKNIILSGIGHQIDMHNDEPEAYLLQWVFDQILYSFVSIRPKC